ncbi:MAG: aldo/keto reductase [Alphaproteobacteria bacterium]|nr:aldo/keto reductase [Alphaproteobacteria bacterium]
MQYTTLGRSGLKVSRICLGGNSWGAKDRRSWAPFDAEASRPFFKRALDRGINFFDTADVYNAGASETVMGQCLIGQVSRDDLVIATKLGLPMSDKPNRSGLGRKHMMASIDASLKRLRTDYVDLYYIHRFDPSTPTEEIMSGLAEIVRAGKARYIGASTMWAYQFARLQLFATANGLPPFIAMQNLYNLLYREEEREMIPFCREEGVAITPYSPLARGVLSGTRNRSGGGATERAREDKQAASYFTDESFAIVDRVVALAQARGVTPAQIALAWLLHRPGLVAPVIGSTRLEQIDEADAATSVILDAEAIQSLDELYRPRPVIGL